MEKWTLVLGFSHHFVRRSEFNIFWLKIPYLIKFSSPFTLILFWPLTCIKWRISGLCNYLRGWLLIPTCSNLVFSIVWSNGGLYQQCSILSIRYSIYLWKILGTNPTTSVLHDSPLSHLFKVPVCEMKNALLPVNWNKLWIALYCL